MKIYITRHSKTLWNQEKRLQGHGDSPLSQDGIENAQALKQYIQQQHYHFDYIYSSPIARAYSTACLLFDEKDIIKDDRLMEMNFGVYEGMKIEDIKKIDYDHHYYNLWNHPENYTRIPKGESYDDVVKRVQSFLEDLKKLDDQANVMIITHGMYFIVLLATMLGVERKDYVQFNRKVVEGCSLTLVSYRHNRFSLDIYNKHDFLPHISDTRFIK